jgi:hypothetical protein
MRFAWRKTNLEREIHMNISERFESLKPVLGGIVGGAIGITVLGFATGLVVTSNSAADSVREARVVALASVCQELASNHWLAQGNAPDELSGWRNEQRTSLAQQFVTGGDPEIHNDVANACDRLLRTS